jgi:hypothetical protein
MGSVFDPYALLGDPPTDSAAPGGPASGGGLRRSYSYEFEFEGLLSPLEQAMALLAASGTVDHIMTLEQLGAAIRGGGAAAAGPPETCPDPECGGAMRRGAANLTYECGTCGWVEEGDTTAPDADESGGGVPSAPPPLRRVGADAPRYQGDLYRTGGGATSESQQQHVYEEYLAYRERYIEAGGRAFPQDALNKAAGYYHVLQSRHIVKRNQAKRQIMASCLWGACIEIGFAPTKIECARFMQLETDGIAKGDNFLRHMDADEKMTIEIDPDPTNAEIATLFLFLSYDGPAHAPLRRAVKAVVDVASAKKVCTNSKLRSKVYGATLAVLERCTDRALLAKPPTIQDICGGRIRVNTVNKVKKDLDDYFEAFFKPIYAAAGLSVAARPGR